MPQSINKIVSGGQTGVDRAALDVALSRNIPCGGWCPKGRKAEDATIDIRYPLTETPSSDYSQRTEWNVRDSDGTLILCLSKPSGGTALTIRIAKRLQKPCVILDLLESPDTNTFVVWLESHSIKTLNIAGPRESKMPGTVYSRAREYLDSLLDQLKAADE